MPTSSNSREKILDVAEALFASRGFAGVGLSAVADQVGLKKSSLFHHFPSKAVLYAEVLGRVVSRIEAGVGPALAASGRAAERIDRVIDQLIDALAEHPTSARLLLRSLFEDDTPRVAEATGQVGLDDRIQALLDGVGAIVSAGIESGEFRPVAIPDLLQTLIGATIFHYASGPFGETLFGGPLFTSGAVARRKREVRSLLHGGLLPPARA